MNIIDAIKVPLDITFDNKKNHSHKTIRKPFRILSNLIRIVWNNYLKIYIFLCIFFQSNCRTSYAHVKWFQFKSIILSILWGYSFKMKYFETIVPCIHVSMTSFIWRIRLRNSPQQKHDHPTNIMPDPYSCIVLTHCFC